MSSTSTPQSQKIVEKGGPNDRYFRFAQKLGSGAYKQVWLAYDSESGKEVAWNTVNLRKLPPRERKRIRLETFLLQKLGSHPNIVEFFHVWDSADKESITFTTEIVTSGTLKQYIQRVKTIKKKIIKKWCRQILKGLEYLHKQNPPIIHRDLKCDNIFIKGATGDILLGDLGLATMRAQTHVKSVLGTPEFMAPELFDEWYTEKVDLYAFGMCVLEMVSNEYPYEECSYTAQIYKKVVQGEKPQVLSRINDKAIKDFINLCLSPEEYRLSAFDLLHHPFLYRDADPTDRFPISISASPPQSHDRTHRDSFVDVIPDHLAPELPLTPLEENRPVDDDGNKFSPPERISPKHPVTPGKTTVKCNIIGNPKNNLSLVDLDLFFDFDNGRAKDIKFQYHFDNDTPSSIGEEMINELELEKDYLPSIVNAIDSTVKELRIKYLDEKMRVQSLNPKLKDTKGKSPSPTKGSSVIPNTASSSTSDSTVAYSLFSKYFRNVKIKDLKIFINRYHGDWTGLTEKSDLVQLLLEVAPQDVKNTWLSAARNSEEHAEHHTEETEAHKEDGRKLRGVFEDALLADKPSPNFVPQSDTNPPFDPLTKTTIKKNKTNPIKSPAPMVGDGSQNPYIKVASPPVIGGVSNVNKTIDSRPIIETLSENSLPPLSTVSSNRSSPIDGVSAFPRVPSANLQQYATTDVTPRASINNDIFSTDLSSLLDTNQLSILERAEYERLIIEKKLKERELLDKFLQDKETIDHDSVSKELALKRRVYQRLTNSANNNVVQPTLSQTPVEDSILSTERSLISPTSSYQAPISTVDLYNGASNYYNGSQHALSERHSYTQHFFPNNVTNPISRGKTPPFAQDPISRGKTPPFAQDPILRVKSPPFAQVSRTFLPSLTQNKDPNVKRSPDHLLKRSSVDSHISTESKERTMKQKEEARMKRKLKEQLDAELAEKNLQASLFEFNKSIDSKKQESKESKKDSKTNNKEFPIKK